jgi:hypothetical protein
MIPDNRCQIDNLEKQGSVTKTMTYTLLLRMYKFNQDRVIKKTEIKEIWYYYCRNKEIKWRGEGILEKGGVVGTSN